jgi:hypothetical protein
VEARGDGGARGLAGGRVGVGRGQAQSRDPVGVGRPALPVGAARQRVAADQRVTSPLGGDVEGVRQPPRLVRVGEVAGCLEGRSDEVPGDERDRLREGSFQLLAGGSG